MKRGVMLGGVGSGRDEDEMAADFVRAARRGDWRVGRLVGFAPPPHAATLPMFTCVRTFVFLRPIMPKNHEKYPMAPSASPCPLYPFRWLEVRVRWLDP